MDHTKKPEHSKGILGAFFGGMTSPLPLVRVELELSSVTLVEYDSFKELLSSPYSACDGTRFKLKSERAMIDSKLNDEISHPMSMYGVLRRPKTVTLSLINPKKILKQLGIPLRDERVVC
mmetsp:Transcript_8281/g.22985  ORF Transcript_8281/g.22985 Transcript_8281/m.22985 type:complete len:120 (-) Transcript_8281:289-648(-)